MSELFTTAASALSGGILSDVVTVIKFLFGLFCSLAVLGFIITSVRGTRD